MLIIALATTAASASERAKRGQSPWQIDLMRPRGGQGAALVKRINARDIRTMPHWWIRHDTIGQITEQPIRQALQRGEGVIWVGSARRETTHTLDIGASTPSARARLREAPTTLARFLRQHRPANPPADLLPLAIDTLRPNLPDRDLRHQLQREPIGVDSLNATRATASILDPNGIEWHDSVTWRAGDGHAIALSVIKPTLLATLPIGADALAEAVFEQARREHCQGRSGVTAQLSRADSNPQTLGRELALCVTDFQRVFAVPTTALPTEARLLQLTRDLTNGVEARAAIEAALRPNDPTH